MPVPIFKRVVDSSIDQNYQHTCKYRWPLGWHGRIMMSSSNGNIFRVTGPLCGEFTGHKVSDAEFDVSLISVLIKRMSKQWWAGDLSCRHAHYDVIVMITKWDAPDKGESRKADASDIGFRKTKCIFEFLREQNTMLYDWIYYSLSKSSNFI